MAGREGKGRGVGLAGRFRAALDQQAQAQRSEEQARAQQEERARQARQDLLAELAAFGEALGHAAVQAGPERVAIQLDGRELCFQAQEEPGALAVSGPGLRPGWQVRLQPELGAWGLYPPYGAARPLFDKGLEELMRRVFELRPAEEEQPADGAESGAVTAGDERSPGAEAPPRRTL